MLSKRLTLCCVLLAMTVTMAMAADLPLSRVVLFSSGVGYFEREGTVEGDASIELSFRTAQINDILKSLVLQDLGGGTIAPVTYAPQDPLERVLSSFEVNISDNPSIAELWDMLRGAKVRVVAETTVEGVVFGAEKQEKAAGETVFEFDVLNLMTDKGLVEIPLWHVTSFKILDERLEGDLKKALEAIDKARDANKRPVTLSFKGEGERTVRVGYLLESPVWKTSYRLVVGKEDLLLQGWAIVENTTDDDWNEVALSMVSGRPVSFIQNLYEPLYIRRPVVPVSVARAAAPRVWEGAMEEMAEEEAPMVELAFGRKMARRTRTARPPGMAGGMAAPSAPPPAEMDLATTGAASMAAAGKVGTLFQYAINQPVTVPRQRSAMIPIINDEVTGEKVSVYNQSADAKHPMNGLKLKNSTELHLMGGPITVFDGGVYGGDALIEDVAPGEERLITYAMDLAVEVDPKSKSHPQKFLSAKIVRGVMTVSLKNRMETTYTVKNSADEKRIVLVEHPLSADWKLIEPEKATETTRNAYRFRLEIEPGKSEALKVVTERTRFESAELADTDADEVAFMLKAPQLSARMKDALQELMAMQRELGGLETQREEKETRIEEIEEEQERIRKNMRELDRQSQLYRQYVEKFTKQELEFEKLRGEVKQLRGQEAEKEKVIEDYIAGLTVE